MPSAHARRPVLCCPHEHREAPMIARDLEDGRALCSRRKCNADLAAQFAARWGNARFARLSPEQTMLRAANLHDTHFRETETDCPSTRRRAGPMGIVNHPSRRPISMRSPQTSNGSARAIPTPACSWSMHHTHGPRSEPLWRDQCVHNDYGAANRRARCAPKSRSS